MSTSDLYLLVGLLCLICAALLVVLAFHRPKLGHRQYRLTTAFAHGCRVGETLTIPGYGLCVVTAIEGPTVVVLEPQHAATR